MLVLVVVAVDDAVVVNVDVDVDGDVDVKVGVLVAAAVVAMVMSTVYGFMIIHKVLTIVSCLTNEIKYGCTYQHQSEYTKNSNLKHAYQHNYQQS